MSPAKPVKKKARGKVHRLLVLHFMNSSSVSTCECCVWEFKRLHRNTKWWKRHAAAARKRGEKVEE